MYQILYYNAEDRNNKFGLSMKYPVNFTPEDDANVSIDDFLGGVVRLIQPIDGYRISLDTVLLAASIPAKAGERVLDIGVGSGGAAICLAVRVPDVMVTGVDVQDAMIDLSRRNIALNCLQDQITVERATVIDRKCPEATFDHVMLNPPYLPAGKAIRPPETNKGLAHMEDSGTIKDWIMYAVHRAKIRGTISIVYRADRIDEVIAHMHRRIGDIKIYPFWPRAGQPAKRVIIQGRKGMHGAAALLPGLALHGEKERFSPAAEAILRDGQALNLL